MTCGVAGAIRTLSSKHRAYNPISYQLGSVWPFDNSIIAAGFKRYGYHEEVNKIAEGIFAAAGYFNGGRLPEVFGGIQRCPDNFPVPYIDANSPQAWSSGAICLLLCAMLGLEADAPQRKLKVSPVLPDWMPDIEISKLNVADAEVGIKFWREGDKTLWKVTNIVGDLQFG